jgi:uncharacterized membrane protein YkoI
MGSGTSIVDTSNPDHERESAMNIIKTQPLLVGLSVAGGATALVIALTSAGAASSPAPVSARATDPGTTAAAAIPSSSVSLPTPVSTPVSTPVQVPVSTPVQAPVSLDQARATAERVAGGRADKVEAEAGGVYDISVLRANGTEVQVVIDGRNGRVVSNVAEAPDVQDQSEIGQPDAAEATNGADSTDPTDSTEQPGG